VPGPSSPSRRGPRCSVVGARGPRCSVVGARGPRCALFTSRPSFCSALIKYDLSRLAGHLPCAALRRAALHTHTALHCTHTCDLRQRPGRPAPWPPGSGAALRQSTESGDNSRDRMFPPSGRHPASLGYSATCVLATATLLHVVVRQYLLIAECFR
jgi:hypothetical protein